jgi:D-3-phosphoglycerate dehydrogenase
MRVVVTDHTFPDLDIERDILQAAGATLVAAQTKDVEELKKAVAVADAVITQFAPVNAQVVAAMDRARAIVRYGIGFDNVDIDAARAKNIVTHTNKVHAGTWGLATPLSGLQALCRTTVGVVGFGRIGRAVVRRLVAFGGKVLVHDPVVPTSAITGAGATSADLPTLLSQSDCVTLHCPSLPQTKNLINPQSLASMKTGALLINLARGDLVDPAALVQALDSGKLAGAALDVFNPEPIPAGHPILNRPNVILAPHIASASVAAVTRLRQSAATLAVAALRGEPLGSIVNGVTR